CDCLCTMECRYKLTCQVRKYLRFWRGDCGFDLLKRQVLGMVRVVFIEVKGFFVFVVVKMV
ncbi:hypothetical protein B6U67_00590, partial [Methanosarcinales archaeon ex4484_138]